MQAAQSSAGKEWRAHVDTARTLEASLQTSMPDANSQLTVIAADVTAVLTTLGVKERYVNSQHESARNEYSKVCVGSRMLSLSVYQT